MLSELCILSNSNYLSSFGIYNVTASASNAVTYVDTTDDLVDTLSWRQFQKTRPFYKHKKYYLLLWNGLAFRSRRHKNWWLIRWWLWRTNLANHRRSPSSTTRPSTWRLSSSSALTLSQSLREPLSTAREFWTQSKHFSVLYIFTASKNDGKTNFIHHSK